MGYIAVHILCSEMDAESISFLLQHKDYLGSSYVDGKLIAYCPDNLFNQEVMEDILEPFDIDEIWIEKEEEQNWNELWESNFKDIWIDQIHIRAPFHPEEECETEIIINPKMAFGTGHHATTQLMIKALRKLDLLNKKVLDMGCGSGILAIYASLRGAEEVLAVDIDPYSVENSIENAQLNKRKNVNVLEGSDLQGIEDHFDVIISNIIRSVNLQLLPSYVEHSIPGSFILLSGVLKEDEKEMQEAAEALNLQLHNKDKIENWIQLTYKKP